MPAVDHDGDIEELKRQIITTRALADRVATVRLRPRARGRSLRGVADQSAIVIGSDIRLLSRRAVRMASASAGILSRQVRDIQRPHVASILDRHGGW
jgi:hypothetical protein